MQGSESYADPCKEIDVLVGEAQIKVDAPNDDIQKLMKPEVIEVDESTHITDNIEVKILEDATHIEKNAHETANSDELGKKEDSISTPSDEWKANGEHSQENVAKQ